MADALSAAGLLLAALALVYSAWSPQIDAAKTKPMGTTAGEIDRNKDDVRAVRNGRAVPLLVASVLILVAFLPRDLGILCSISKVGEVGYEYDDIAAIFLLTQVLVTAFSFHLWTQIRQLSKRLK